MSAAPSGRADGDRGAEELGDPTVGWFRAHVPDISGDLLFERITVGRSNLTYKVTDVSAVAG